MGLLDDKVAVITGAANGIGKATALLFAREGARVLLCDNGVDPDGRNENPSAVTRVQQEILASGGTAIASAESVASLSSAQRIIEQARDEFGGLDVLVNNAGILRDKSFVTLDEQDFDDVLAVHVKGTFACSQAAARLMKASGGGSIIMATAIAGLIGNLGQTAYATANAAVYGLMRTASIELQRFSIRVNAVAPIAKTRLTQDLPLFEQVDSMTADHVAPLQLYLGSDLSRDTTGMVISAAGGRLSVYRMTESAGRFKESAAGIWSAHEIAEHFASIRRF